MRGQRLFKEIIKGDGLGAPAQKGRNNRLLEKRNKCLLARYYYYGYFKNFCYEEIIRELVNEFFLSPNTIAAIVQQNVEQLHAMRKHTLVVYSFQNRWPHLKW
jgi:hypothetical protein